MEKQKKLSVILDTDIGPDCDDAGALAILNVLEDMGEAKILGVTHCTSSIYGAGCIDAINRFYNHGHIPIGILKTEGFLVGKEYEKYNRYVTENFDNAYKDNNAPDAICLFRKLLSESEDGSVTVIGIGPLINLANLLDSSPDEFSHLSGDELVELKVKELVVMAGRFVADNNGQSFSEWNVLMDIPSAQRVFHDWKPPIILSPWEVGEPIITGRTLMHSTSENNPVKKSYELYTNGQGRMSWDLITVIYAIRGGCKFWELSENGEVTVDKEGVTWFKPSNDGMHYYIMNLAPVHEIEKYIDILLVKTSI